MRKKGSTFADVLTLILCLQWKWWLNFWNCPVPNEIYQTVIVVNAHFWVEIWQFANLAILRLYMLTFEIKSNEMKIWNTSNEQINFHQLVTSSVRSEPFDLSVFDMKTICLRSKCSRVGISSSILIYISNKFIHLIYISSSKNHFIILKKKFNWLSF